MKVTIDGVDYFPTEAYKQPPEPAIYAGLTIYQNASHHLWLLPGEKENVNWKDALAWADNQGRPPLAHTIASCGRRRRNMGYVDCFSAA